MEAILGPLMGDSLCKSKCCSGVRVLPGEEGMGGVQGSEMRR